VLAHVVALPTGEKLNAWCHVRVAGDVTELDYASADVETKNQESGIDLGTLRLTFISADSVALAWKPPGQAFATAEAVAVWSDEAKRLSEAAI